MSGISLLSSGSGALPFGGQQVRVRESKRAAEQAEQVARDLRQKADVAQQDADRAQSTAQGLGIKASRAEAHAGQVRQGSAVVAPADTAPVAQVGQVKPVSNALNAEAPAVEQQASPMVKSAASVIGLGGQKLGQLINVTA